VHAYHAWAFERRDSGVYVLTEETQNGWLARLGALVMPGRMSRWYQRWLEGARHSDALTSILLCCPMISPGIHAQVDNRHQHSGLGEPDRGNVRINELVEVMQ
jgi:hypothetical protein